jgi:hypothetical protein
MDPRQQLAAVEQQKRQLQARIQQIDSTKVDEREGEQAELGRLLQRKKMVRLGVCSWRSSAGSS